MKSGAWHQMGDKSQKLVLEQLDAGSGVGAIVSPRDLALQNAADYAAQYRDRQADVLYDPQFHVPSFSNSKLSSYKVNPYRASVTTLNRIGAAEVDQLSAALEEENRLIGTSAVIAPAVVYEAQRQDIIDLNAQLFSAAKRVGDALGVPTYATIFVGLGATSSMIPINSILSGATAAASDGWYFAYEFDQCRLPATGDAVSRYLETGLALAGTGKPVLNAYAGPLGLLAPGFGATGAAVGHSQTLWRFCRERWAPAEGGGGDGSAPPRFFSKALWGTIVYPDEVQQLPTALRARVLTHSPFSQALTSTPPGDWGRWDGNKHLLYIVCSGISEVAAKGSARDRGTAAAAILANAVSLHQEIFKTGLALRDATDGYQKNWQHAVLDLQVTRATDFDYLELL